MYIVNIGLILIGFLSSIVSVFINPITTSVLLRYFYDDMRVVSTTWCIFFLGLNLFGAMRYKQYRVRFLLLSGILALWIAWGIYQLVNAPPSNVIL